LAAYKIKISRLHRYLLRTPNRNVATELSDKAKILNIQFKSVFTVEASNTTPYMGISPHASTDKNEITQQGVPNLLIGHELHKSPGPDGISALFLKNTATEIVHTYANIYFSICLLVGPCHWLGNTLMYLPFIRKAAK